MCRGYRGGGCGSDLILSEVSHPLPFSWCRVEVMERRSGARTDSYYMMPFPGTVKIFFVMVLLFAFSFLMMKFHYFVSWISSLN